MPILVFSSFAALSRMPENTDLNTNEVLTAYFFSDHKKNVGDTNALKGIAAALEKQASQKGINIQCNFVSNEIDPLSQQSILFENFINNNPTPDMVFGAGDSGLRAIAALKARNIETKYYWAGHQPFAALIEQANDLDLIALPSHTLNAAAAAEIFGANADKVIFTVGVAHNVSMQSLQTALENWRNNLELPQIPAAKKYIGVFLGGDAPLPTGEKRLYTAVEAIALAKYVTSLLDQDTALLLVDGPRTAKNVTAEFLNALTSEVRTKTFFYEFKNDAPRAAQPVMATLMQQQNNIVFLPGESTSVISECLLDPQQVIIVRNQAMNNNHEQHVDAMRNIGYKVIHLDGDNFKAEPYENISRLPTLAAADLVANKALQLHKNTLQKQGDRCLTKLQVNS